MELNSVEEFRRIRNLYADEFIVITDSPTGDVIHIAMCDSVKESDFITKVKENEKKFGRYYHFKTYQEAKTQIPTSTICKNCSKYFKGRK